MLLDCFLRGMSMLQVYVQIALSLSRWWIVSDLNRQ